jgi:hypothetical protein
MYVRTHQSFQVNYTLKIQQKNGALFTGYGTSGEAATGINAASNRQVVEAKIKN